MRARTAEPGSAGGSGLFHGLPGNAARASISPFSNLLLAALLVIAARLLGEADYGRFAFALSLAMIFETIINFGLNQVTTREIARNRLVAPLLLANTFGLKLILAGVAAAGLWLSTHLLGTEPEVRAACYLLGAASIFRSYMLTLRHTLQGLERFGLDGAVVIADRVLLLGLGVSCLLGGFGVPGLAASFVGARLLSLLLAWQLAARQVGRIWPAFDFAFWRGLQSRAVPYGIFVLILYFHSHLDTVMLWVMRDDAETGLYSAAYRVYEGLASLPGLMQMVLVPRLAAHHAVGGPSHSRLSQAALRLGTAAAIPIALGMVLVAPRAVTLLYGAAYAESGAVLQILTAGFIFVYPLFLLQAIALSSGSTATLVRTALVGCGANGVLNVLLIPQWGMYGAAVATVTGEALSAAVMAWELRSQIVGGRDSAA